MARSPIDHHAVQLAQHKIREHWLAIAIRRSLRLLLGPSQEAGLVCFGLPIIVLKTNHTSLAGSPHPNSVEMQNATHEEQLLLVLSEFHGPRPHLDLEMC